MNSIFLPSKRNAAKAIMVAAVHVAAAVPRVKPLPVAAWPAWAADLSKERQAGDIGIGDTVVHVIGDKTSEAFKAWFVERLGKSCGCTERQRWLNMRFPYERKAA